VQRKDRAMGIVCSGVSVQRLMERHLPLKRRSPLARAALAVMLLAAATPAWSQKLPTGGSVTAGGATIVQPNSSTLNINQSTGQAIINWNSFSVGQGGTVNFNQPNSSSATLNRVTGSTPSWIAGTINAPGTVLLVNPNGIEISRSGVVNAGSFAASTLNITDSDFLSGHYSFSGNGGSAGIINNGRINVSDGGFAALLGGQVANNGVISARLGFVALGAGEQATLDLSGDGFLSVAVPSSELGKLVNPNGALVSNKGTINANGGTVFLSAATAANILRNAVNIPGSIRTNSVGMHNGRIAINGGGGNVRITGRLAANGGRKHNGGSITVTGADVSVAGKLSASGRNGGSVSVVSSGNLWITGTTAAQGLAGSGGLADLTGSAVTLAGAAIDASGTAGGGTINIGGGPHSTVALADAQIVSVDAATVIRADATDSGNGGHIVVWSAGQTTAAGTLSAIGGPNGGNGGSIETSGETLTTAGVSVNASAAHGAASTWLLDPTDLIIDATLAGEIDATLNGGTGVTLLTSATGDPTTPYALTAGEFNTSGTGDIDVDSPIAWTTGAALTLSAYDNVVVNANITSTGGGAVTLHADNTGTGTGTVTFGTNNQVSTSGAVTIFYNPPGNNNATVNSSSYTTPTNYSGNVTGGAALTSYMLVNTVYDLQNIQNDLSGTYALGTNIDASITSGWNSGAGFAPIGAYATQFTGIFNGQGKTISGLTIDQPSVSYVGMFSVSAGTIENVGLTNVNISADSYVGALVGYNTGTVTNASSSGTLTATYGLIGGLVGTDDGAITSSSSSATVIGFYGIGGLVGYVGYVNPSASVTLSYATGNVTGTGAYNQAVGGLVGVQYRGTISQSYATGTATGYNSIGGLVGVIGGGSDSQVYALGAVSGNYEIGGLVGNMGSDNAASSLTNAYAKGSVTVNGGGEGGGLIGEIDSGTKPGSTDTYTTVVSDTYSTGVVSAINGGKTLGGLIGDRNVGNLITVSDSYWDGTVNPSLTKGLGSGSSTGITTTDDSTSLLQSATLPSGFSPTIWSVIPNVTFPYFGQLQSVISGTVYSSYGGSAVGAGVSVFDLVNGTAPVSSVTTNASGQYVFLLNSLLGPGSQLIVYEGSGASGGVAFQEGASGSVTGLNIYETYVAQNAASSSASLSTVAADFATAQGTSTIPTPANMLINITAPAFTIDQAISTGTLILSATGTVTQTAAITATGLDLLGSGAAYTLAATSNSIDTLAANSGTINVDDSIGLAVGSVAGADGVTGSGAVTLSTAGNLTIASGDPVTSTGSGDNVVLSAAADFVNDAGSNAISVTGTGRWLIYSSAPGTDSFGNLNSNNTAIWDATIATLPSGSVTATGNRYLFAYQPTLTFTSTGTLTKSYGQDATAAVAASSYTVTGLQSGVANAFLGDTDSTAFSGTPTPSSTGAAASANASATLYGIAIGLNSLTALNGYAFAAPVDNGTLTVNPATLTLTGTKIYDSTTIFAASDFSSGTIATGINGQTLTLTGFGSVASPSVSAGMQMLALGSLTLVSGTGLASNYRIATTGNTGAITPATTYPPSQFIASTGPTTTTGVNISFNNDYCPRRGAQSCHGPHDRRLLERHRRRLERQQSARRQGDVL
jgi:filamentous hemagglutinin family protein